jgi:hypothetical protein
MLNDFYLFTDDALDLENKNDARVRWLFRSLVERDGLDPRDLLKSGIYNKCAELEEPWAASLTRTMRMMVPVWRRLTVRTQTLAGTMKTRLAEAKASSLLTVGYV